jgi:uncharacterized protein
VGRLIFIALAVLLLVWLLRRALRERGKDAAREAGDAGARLAQELVRCTHCGVHLPRADAVMAEARVYCSPAHARLGQGGS